MKYLSIKKASVINVAMKIYTTEFLAPIEDTTTLKVLCAGFVA